MKDWAVAYWPQRNRVPCRVPAGLMQDYRVRAIQELSCGCFEVFRCGVENREIEIGAQEFHDAVGFDDDIAGPFEMLAEAWHGFGESSLLGANPEYARGSGNQKARGVGLTRSVALFRDRPGVVTGCAIAGLAIGGADSVAVLGNLHSRPIVLRKGGNQACDNARLAYASGMAAYDYQ